MTAKEFLMQPRKLNSQIDRRLERLDELRTLAAKRTSQLHHAPSGAANSRPMEDAVAALADLQADIDREIDTLCAKKHEIDVMLDKLPDARYQEILNLRYLQGEDWVSIMDELDISETTVFRLHTCAVKALDELLQSEDESKRE